MTMENVVRRWTPPAFFLCALLLYVHQTIVKVLPTLEGPSDFAGFQQAAQAVVSGKSPFVVARYLYPPLLAFLLTPLARFDYVTARWLWFLFSQGCLLAAAWLLWRFLGRDWLAACSVAFVWAAGGAAFENLSLGQVGPLLTLLLTLAYTTASARGSMLGFATAVKIFPGVAVVPLLLRRMVRAALSLIATALAFTLIPWLVVAMALDGPRTPAAAGFHAGTPAILSWSLPSVALRALDPPRAGMDLPRNWEAGNDVSSLQLPPLHRVVSTAVAIFTFLGGTALFAFAAHGRFSGARIHWDIAAFMALLLAAAPVVWTHYQLLQYPAVAMLLCELSRSRRWTLGIPTLACGAFLYPAPVAVLRNYYEQRGGSWAPAAPATLFFWTSIAPIASLALFAILTRMACEESISQ